jgi:rod shape-determining protein MreD
VRKTLIAVASLAIALVLQLVVLNGLHLPGGGVPDLVLVLVAALAVTGGPVRGMVTGFAAGLVLDLAPPGSAVLGEYALTFCLVGWAAAKLSGQLDKSVLRPLLALAGIVALGEALAASIGAALDPAQLSWAQVRQVLPAAIGYDLLILPFALYLALLAGAWAAAGRLDSDLHATSALAEHSRKRQHKQPQRREPRLGAAAVRPHDGWVGSGPGSRTGAPRRAASPHGLRAGHGVAGSAVTGVHTAKGLPAVPVNLRLAGRRRGFGVVGNPVGTGLSNHAGLHPGARRPPVRRGHGSRGFRPQAGLPGGSAVRPGTSRTRPGGRRPASMKFGARRGDATVGRLLGTPRSGGSGPGLLGRTGHSTRRLQFGRAAAPRFRASTLAAPRSRPKAVPRFRRAYATMSPALTAGLAGGGAVSQHDLLSARRAQLGVPRLRLSSRRRGLLPSLSLRPHRPARRSRPRFRAGSRPAPSRSTGSRQPRFGYGRHSVLAFLVGHRAGGRWLAGTKAGSRANVWLIGRRTGGTR